MNQPIEVEDDIQYDKDFDLFITMNKFKDAGWLLTIEHHGESFHVQARHVQHPFVNAIISWTYEGSVWVPIHGIQLLLNIPFHSAANKSRS